METAGLPVRLAGMVSAPLFPMALLKPCSAMRSTSPTVVGMGPAAAKAVSGLVAAEDEVGLVEDVGHPLVDVDPEHLGGSGGLHVEVVGGQVHAQLDLGGEVVGAGRVAVAQGSGQADQVGHGPLQAALGQVDHHVDPGRGGARRSGPRPPRSAERPSGAPRWPTPGRWRPPPACRPGRRSRGRPPIPPPGAGSGCRGGRSRCRRRTSGRCPAPSGTGIRPPR